jgi:hypothetical protein
VRDLIGNYGSLPDVDTLADYRCETAAFDVRAIAWSDAGAADPIGAAEWVWRQQQESGFVTGILSLGDPSADGSATSSTVFAGSPWAQREGEAGGRAASLAIWVAARRAT